MHSTLFLAAGGIGDIARETGLQFGFNTQLFISQVISFCVVAFLLHRFAYKPVLKVLEERRQKIAQGLADAEKMRQELLDQAGAQASKIIEEARNAAAKVTETEAQKAIATAQDIVNKAREASTAELAKMKADLRKEIGALAVKAAMQVTGKVLTPEDQRRLAEETNREIAA
jgi:F-type H+-transporting ATPase subunit b